MSSHAGCHMVSLTGGNEAEAIAWLKWQQTKHTKAELSTDGLHNMKT